MQKIANKIIAVLGSRRFLYGVTIFFGIEALWIALSSQYPMAFDEDFHLGIIKLYAGHWLPVLSAHDGATGQFGGVTADPSYLYHYLMSFPYRVIHLFTHNEVAIVIVLRMINIAMFGYAVILFYRLFRAIGTSQTYANAALALFVLVPVVPLLAGQINYDNLFMVFVAWTCLLVLAVYRGFQEHRVNLRTLALLLAVCMFGSIVKYAFLPIAVTAVVFCAVAAWRMFGKKQRFVPALRRGYTALTRRTKIGLIILLAIGLVMCLQRYGANAAKYHTPLPDCSAVLSVNQCLNYGPWARNYTYAGNKGAVDPNPLAYTGEWIKGLHLRLFFVINGPHGHIYQNYPPSPILADAGTAVAIVGSVAVCIYFRRIFGGKPFVVFLLVMPLLYMAALWNANYSDYIETGRVVAVNGRYLIPVLLPLAAVAGIGLHQAFRRMPTLRPYVATLAILLFLQAGGVFAFILRSDDTWYWQNSFVVSANHTAKRIFDPVMHQGAGRD